MKANAIVLTALLLSAPALAQESAGEDKDEASQLRERVSCFEASGIVKFMSKFQKIEADKRDSVDMVFSAGYTVNDDGVLPERLFIRDDDTEIDFTMGADGKISDFGKIGTASKTAELCSEDPSREGTPRSGSDISFSIDSDVQYLENTGYHNLATLKDGLKDGKSYFKKMVPAPMRLLVPKMSHVMINYEAEDAIPQFSAIKDGTPMAGLVSDEYCKQTIIKVEDLETLDADGLQVSGGAYKLMPTPNKKMLEKFTQCDAEQESEEGEVEKE